MKRAVLIAAILAISASAAPPWLKRAGAIAVCASQAADALTTVGLRESNPLLSGRLQQPRWSVIVPMKAGVCMGAVMLAGQKRTNVRAAVPINFAVAGVTTAVAVHNWKLH